MSILPLLAVLVAAVAPYFVWRWYRDGARELYDGPAQVINYGILGKHCSDRGFDYLHVEVPGRDQMLLRCSKDRIRGLRAVTTSILITIRQAPLGKPFIATVIWPGEPVVETVEESDGSLMLSCWYLLLGFASFIVFASYVQQGGLVGHAALYGSALMLALAGFVFSATTNKKPVNFNDSHSRFLGIPLGKGVTGLAVMTALCIVLNAAIFWTPSLLILIGLNTAFAMGGCAALLFKTQRA